MARIAFCTFHNEMNTGLRCLLSYLAERGHRSRMVVLKLYSRKQIDEVPEPPLHTEVHEGLLPGGWQYLSYPTQPTEKEWALWLEVVLEESPNVVCMSLAASVFRIAADATSRLRKARPSIVIIWGGTQPTVAPEMCLRHAEFVCIGEGESTVVALAEAIDAGEPLHDLPNLAYISEDGNLVKNPVAPHVRDLDSLPFQDFQTETNFYIEDEQVYQGEIPRQSTFHGSYMVYSTRGCPYTCSFCIHSVFSKIYEGLPRTRRRSVGNVIAELKKIKERFGPLYICVEDDVFTLDRKWIHEFSEAYSKEVRLPFWCYTHPNCCDEQIIKDLKRAGIRAVIIGIQSGSAEVNKDIYNRATPRQRIAESLSILEKYDIPTYCDLLTNNPVETEENRRETAFFLRECSDSIVLTMGKLVFYPSTPIYEGVEDGENPPKVDDLLYQFWNSVYVHAVYAGLSESELEDLIENEALRKDPTGLERKAIEYINEIHRKTDQRIMECDKRFEESYRRSSHSLPLSAQNPLVKSNGRWNTVLNKFKQRLPAYLVSTGS